MHLPMKRSSTLLCFAFSLLATLQSSAQVFLKVDFASDNLPNGWTTGDLSDNGVTWQICPEPDGCGLEGLPNILAHFNSTTASNGFVVANSDAAGNLPGDGHISRLTSSAIDCNNKNRVFLQFQTAIGTLNKSPANNAILRVTSGLGIKVYRPFAMLETNGVLQTAPIQELANGQAYTVTLDISERAAGQPQVYLEWEWRGNYEFAWIIDDILLSTENPARPDDAVYYESFGNGSNGWTSNPVFSPDSLWKWTPFGDVSNGFGISFAERDAFIHSPSATDGAMAFNADFFNTGGGPPGQGMPITAFVCELISPPIDLSGVESPLALQFSQLGWLGNIASSAPQTQEGASFITSFAYSTDGGTNWSDPIDVNPYQTPVTSFNFRSVPPFNKQAYFDLPPVQGSSDFRIKFTWAGDFYFWVLDDIALVEREARDMKANRNFFAVTPNTVTPVSQLQDEALLCDVVNIGRETAREVRLEAVVRKKGSNAIVYADTLFYGDIPVDSLVENVLFNRRLEAVSLQETGEYEAFYAVGHNQPDDRPQDDTLRWRFRVSDFTFAKEFGPTRDIAPAGSKSYSYGNIFYVPKGEGFFACAASFGIANSAQLANLGEDVTLLFYQWDGDLNEDGMANIEEYQLLSFNSHAFSELDGTGLIHLAISEDGVSQPLQDDTYYMVVVQYESNILNCFMQASDTIDYQAAGFVSDSLGRRQYSSVLDVGNTGTYNTIGFGPNIVPVVRLHLSPRVDCLSSANEAFDNNVVDLKLSPNPAGDWMRLQLDTGKAYRNASLVITSLSGKIVRKEFLGDVAGDLPPLDVSKVPPGVYIVKFRSNEYTAVGKLAVQR